MSRGQPNYYLKYKKCRKMNCRTCREGKGHGPYWHMSITDPESRKTVETYIGKQLPTDVTLTIGRPTQSTLVGRERELKLVQDRLAAVAYQAKRSTRARKTSGLPAAHIPLVLITGDAGIGKTRLAEEAMRVAFRQGWWVAWGRAYASEQRHPYQIWTEICRRAIQAGMKQQNIPLAPENTYLPLLGVLLPEIQAFLPPGERGPLSPEQERLLLWEAIARMLSTISDGRPFLIVLDDLQWADSSSCELLAYLMRQMGSQPMLFLCTCRDSELTTNHSLHSLLAAFQSEHTLLQIPMQSLSDRDIRQLLGHLPEQLAKSISSRASGNPFFAEELARTAAAGAVLEAHKSKRLPDTIQAVLNLRLTRISQECQGLLEHGAVLGHAFSFSTIRDMAKKSLLVSEQHVIDWLDEALHEGILLEEPDDEEIAYHFWHPLLQAYLYERLSATRRVSLHQYAAQALQEHPAGREVEIVEHLAKGHAESATIAHFAELAGNRAYALFSYTEAERYYRLALDSRRAAHFPRHEAEEQEHEAGLLELLGECSRIQGKATAARASYEQALQIYQALHLTEEIQAMLWAEIGLSWYDDGDLARARHHYACGEACLRSAGRESSLAWARLHYERAYCAWREGNYQEARALAREALTIFAQGSQGKEVPNARTTRLRRTLAGDPVDLARAHSLLGSIADTAGQPEEALAEWLEARAMYERYQQIRELAIVCCNLGDLYTRHASYEQATGMLQQALDLAQRMDYAALIGFTIGNLAVIDLRQDRLSMAATRFAQALEWAERCNDRPSISFWSSYAGQVALAQGQREQARAHVVRALRYARQCHVEPYVAIALVTAASFHLVQLSQESLVPGASVKAKRALHRALTLSGVEAETRIEARLLSARLAALEGDHAASRTQAQTALDEAQQCGVEWIIPLVKKWLP
jgi:predicted negative regulator of RcsB-dependent stress response